MRTARKARMTLSQMTLLCVNHELPRKLAAHPEIRRHPESLTGWECRVAAGIPGLKPGG